jgi:CTP synthase
VKKYIVVTGGVLSGIGKGIVSASTGRVLKEYGININSLKIDPYLNVDPGTMNPNQHGEVYVTDDGYEADLDLGHYERFLGKTMGRENNVTAGQIYRTIIDGERKGKFLGATVQIVPHVTDKIKERIRKIEADVVMVEIGGTVGDIEGEIFLEAVRQLTVEEGLDNFFFIHVTYVPYLRVTNEFKTKPTQQSVQLLRRIGIHPNMIIVRSETEVDSEVMDKISLFGGVPHEMVINLPDSNNVYSVPEMLHNNGIHNLISKKLHLNLSGIFNWKYPTSFKNVKIALIGKYLGTDDAYKSILESLTLCGVKRPEVLDSEDLEEMTEEQVSNLLSKYDGLIIPGGFGKRGIEGKIKACSYARKCNTPILGICLGMQVMVIEYARNVLGMKDANSVEFDKNTPFPVIDIMEKQKKVLKMGGTMRLGSQRAIIMKDSKLMDIYDGKGEIHERHRHRYEVNYEKFKEMFSFPDNIKENTLVISAKEDFVEAVELPEKLFYVGIQYHPEFKSQVGNPHPLFKNLIETITRNK